MLLVVNGPSGAGKTTIREPVAAMLGCESVEIRTLRPDKPVRTTTDRQAIGERVVAKAVELAAHGHHLLFCGDPFPLGEVLACPSATEVDIAACHLDIAEHEQVRRLRQRGEPEDSLVHHVAFATWMRKHARDPRSAPHVITENGWERMAWDRWLGRDDLVGIWRCEVIDATALAPDQVIAAVTDWGRRAIAGDTPVFRRHWASLTVRGFEP